VGMMDNLDNWQTLESRAEELGVSRRRMNHLALSGRIPGARKIGRQWFVPRGTMDDRKLQYRRKGGR